MTTYAIFCVPAHGHINPTFALAQELVARGEQVIYYQAEELRPAVEATGALFRPYEYEAWKKLTPYLASTLTGKPNLSARIGMMTTLMLESISEILPLLGLIVADHVDCVLYDRTFMTAAFVSQILHLPAVQLSPSYVASEQVFKQMAGLMTDADRSAISEQLAVLNEKLAREFDTYNLPHYPVHEFLARVEDLNIVFLPRAFHPAGDTFDQRFVFVGPSLPAQRYYSGDFPLERLDKRPLLYISLGTAFNNWLEFYQMCFDAFAQTEWQVVLSFGTRIDPAVLKEPPANFLIAPHVPQLQVLPRADLFISHGGMNSTMESLAFGVPLVVVPQMWEQELTARRVQELGLGLALDRNTLTAEQLRVAVEQVMHDTSFREHVQGMQQEIREAGGYQRATSAIQTYLSSR